MPSGQSIPSFLSTVELITGTKCNDCCLHTPNGLVGLYSRYTETCCYFAIFLHMHQRALCTCKTARCITKLIVVLCSSTISDRLNADNCHVWLGSDGSTSRSSNRRNGSSCNIVSSGWCVHQVGGQEPLQTVRWKRHHLQGLCSLQRIGQCPECRQTGVEGEIKKCWTSTIQEKQIQAA